MEGLMSEARFRFYAELNDFLPAETRMKPIARRFDVSGSVKDFIEGFEGEVRGDFD